MTNAQPLRDVFTALAGEPGHEAPGDVLAAHGHPDLPEGLVAEAVVSYADTAPIEVAEHLAPYVMAHSPVPDQASFVEDPPDWLHALSGAAVAEPVDVDPGVTLDHPHDPGDGPGLGGHAILPGGDHAVDPIHVFDQGHDPGSHTPGIDLEQPGDAQQMLHFGQGATALHRTDEEQPGHELASFAHHDDPDDPGAQHLAAHEPLDAADDASPVSEPADLFGPEHHGHGPVDDHDLGEHHDPGGLDHL
jgi:hypothetical protein